MPFLIRGAVSNVRAVQLWIKAGKIFDRIIGFFGAVSAALIAYVLLVICVDVCMRYFFNRPLVWQSDVTKYVLVYVAFLGTAWVLRKGGHVSVDIVVNSLNRSTRGVLNIIVSIIGALSTLVLAWHGVTACIESFQTGASYTNGMIIHTYLVLGVIPLGSFLLFIQFMRDAYGYLMSFRMHMKQEEQS